MLLLWENIKFAFQALLSSKARSFLTMLGVIIGVFSVITLMSIGEGVRSQFANEIEVLGSNLVIVLPGQMMDQDNSADSSGHGNLGFNPTATVGVSTLSLDDVQAVKDQASKITQVAPMMMLSGLVHYQDQESANSILLATTPELFQIFSGREINLTQGRLFEQAEMDNKARQVVIGEITKNALFGAESKAEEIIGKKINFLQEEFEIIGYLETKKTASSQMSGAFYEAMIFLPLTTAQEITENTQIFRIVASTADPHDVEEAKKQVKEIILKNHKAEEDFSVITQEDILGMFDKIFGILTKALTGIAAISLIVGGIGIMNIMLVSVTERTKEIGIRKAIGASNLNILIQFLVEAAILSLFGGAIGVGLAFLAGQGVETYASIPTLITLKALILAFSISVGVGIVFGLAPAIKAARKDPIEALRYE